MIFTLKKLAKLVNGRLVGDPTSKILGVNSLDTAQKNELSFFSSPKYFDKLQKSLAGSIVVANTFEIDKGLAKNWIFVDNPRIAFSKIQDLFLVPKNYSKTISPQAVVHKSAKIGSDNTIYPLVFIDRETIIGSQNVIYPSVFIGEKVKIGNNCTIYPNCSIMDKSIIGNNVIIHSGTVIGSDGFGYEICGKKHSKITQTGSVEICDNVEIGSNCSIDRATSDFTTIGEGTKIDNLVHIAHNVNLGKNNILLAGTIISGSNKFGDNVYCLGHVGILGHNQVGDDVIFYPGSAFFGQNKKISAKSKLAGSPAVAVEQWKKSIILQKKVEFLEKKLKQLESKSSTKIK